MFVVSIRAYGAQARFHLESRKRVNRWIRAARTFTSLTKWFSIRSELLAAIFNAGLATYLVYGSSADAAAIGFTLSMSGSLTCCVDDDMNAEVLLLILVVFSGLIQWWVRYFNEFEVSGRFLSLLSIKGPSNLVPLQEMGNNLLVRPY